MSDRGIAALYEPHATDGYNSAVCQRQPYQMASFRDRSIEAIFVQNHNAYVIQGSLEDLGFNCYRSKTSYLPTGLYRAGTQLLTNYYILYTVTVSRCACTYVLCYLTRLIKAAWLSHPKWHPWRSGIRSDCKPPRGSGERLRYNLSAIHDVPERP